MTQSYEGLTGLMFGETEQLDPYGEQILRAAQALLLEHGLRRTSLADIATAAGVSERTLYRRFADRDTLLRSVVMREVNTLTADLDEALAGVDEPAERLVAAFVVLARLLRGHSLLNRLLITDREALLPLLTTDAGPLVAMGRAWVMQYTAGADVVADHQYIAELLVRLALSLVLTPTTILPFEDDEHAALLARNLFVPLVTGKHAER
jgi:AcrR family transcriptional regulator